MPPIFQRTIPRATRFLFFAWLLLSMASCQLFKGSKPTAALYQEMGHFKQERALVKKDSSYGFIGLDSTLVIPAQFQNAKPFQQGLAAVKKEGKWGFIDTSGAYLVQPFLDSAISFTGSGAWVQDHGRWGLMDTQGQYKKLPEYTALQGFWPGIYQFKKHFYYGLVDATGKELTSLHLDTIQYFNDSLCFVRFRNSWGLVNRRGEELCWSQRLQPANYFSSGLKSAAKNGRWGYMDTLGQWQIPAKYHKAREFKEKRAAVKKNGLWTFIQPNGEALGAFQWMNTRDYSNGLAAVEQDYEWGFINQKGKQVIDCQYKDAGDFVMARAPVEKRVNGKGKLWGYINRKGQEAIPFQYQEGQSFSEGYAGVRNEKGMVFIDTSGQTIIKPNHYSFWAKVKPFRKGLAKVKNPANEEGYVDTNGREVIPVEQGHIYSGGFTKGLVKAKKEDRIGFYNRKGEVVIPFEYQTVRPFDGQTWSSAQDAHGNWGFINRQGKPVIAFHYAKAWNFAYNRAAVLKPIKNYHRWAYINKKGEEVISARYASAPVFSVLRYCRDFYNCVVRQPIAKVRMGSHYGIIDTNGHYLIEPSYDKIEKFSNGWAAAKEGASWTYVSLNGETLTDTKWEEARAFFFGCAAVQRDGSWGILDTSGQLVLPTEYQAVWHDLETGYFMVQKGEKWALFNQHAEQVTEYRFDAVKKKRGFRGIRLFRFGRLAAQRDEAWGFLDTSGKWMVEPQYEEVECFQDAEEITFEQPIAKVKQEGHWGLVDTTGKELIPCMYDRVSSIKHNRIFIEDKGQFFIINAQNECVKQCP